MTELEAKAKDCIENHTHKLVDKPTKQDIYLREESIFISGYKLGATENGIQWHKVTDWKKQEQFPNDETELYLVYINLKYLKIKQYVVCNLDITEGFRQFYDDDSNDEIDPEDVIAWAKIPQFKE